ncbi:MAG TPA: hypothetical protein VMS45_01990 [Gemmatimonadaceae bacterium]|nr:hypothetical protein [Gemmatimonadaceae bacterium]
MSFLFDVPLIIMAPLIVLVLMGLAQLGLEIFRRRMLPGLQFGHSDAHFSGAMLASIMVFYGLAMALIAVHVWVTYEDVATITSHEATSLAALYRDVSEYPEPPRTELQAGLREYTNYVIHEAWPQQHRGQVPGGGVARMDRFQATLMAFEPRTEGQKLLAGETLRAYNINVEARRMRLDAVEVHLPGVLWLIIVIGAIVSVVSAYYFPVVDPRIHRVQVALLTMFIGLVIFLVLALDRPFRGDLGLPSTPYQLVYDHLMAR